MKTIQVQGGRNTSRIAIGESFHNLVRFMAVHSPPAFKKVLAWADRLVYERKKSIVEK